MRRRALLLALGEVLAVGVLLASCRPEPVAAPPQAPRARVALDFVPPDLDVVARLDLGRVRSSLGDAALTALAREVSTRASAQDQTEQLVLESLLGAEVVYLAYRPSALLAPLDRVLALQGRFEQLPRMIAGFSPATDLGGDVRYWDKLPGEPSERGAVARIYAVGTRVRVFLSKAELDSVERTLDGRGSERRLAPPEQGTLAVAIRPLLVARLAPGSTLPDLLSDARSVHGVADLESDGMRLQLVLVLGDSESATRLAAAAQAVVARALPPAGAAGHVGSVDVRAETDRVLLSARLERGELARALACLGGASGSECPW